MQLFQVSEGTAAQRRLFFHAVDATDGITAETGLTGAGRLSKNGAATAATSANITEIDSTNMPGRYYIEFTSGELDTVGIIEFRFKTAACAEVVARGQIVPFDPYDAVRAGLTALPNANAEAAGGLYTRGSGAGQINQNANGQVDSRTVAMAADVVTASAIAADAIGSSELAATAVDEVVNAVWDELTTEGRVANSYGQLVKDNVNATISSRLAPTVAGRTLDVTATGEAGIDLDNTAGALAKGTEITGFNDLDAAGVRGAVGLAAANLDTQLSTIAGFIDTEVAAILAAVDTEVGAIKAKTDNLPASPAATGDAMALTSAAVDAIADEVYEGTLTLRQIVRIVLAAVAGKSSGFPSGPASYRDNADTKDRITATVDADGNRSVVVLDGA